MNSLMFTSIDGTVINYLSTGAGPGLIIVPGAMSTASDYLVLGEALAKRFTVYIMERRGRGLSGPQGLDYGINREIEDLMALQQITGANFVFGHSFGGLISLETARKNQVFTKVAVYDPGVSIDQSIKMGWVPAYQKYLADNNLLDAFVAFSIGCGPLGAKFTPAWLMKRLMPRVIEPARLAHLLALLPANLLEHQVVAALDSSYQNYRQITAETLLLFSGKSGLGWIKKARKALLAVLPKSTLRVFPKLDHFGPDQTGPDEVASALSEFFLDRPIAN